MLCDIIRQCLRGSLAGSVSLLTAGACILHACCCDAEGLYVWFCAVHIVEVRLSKSKELCGRPVCLTHLLAWV